MSGISSIVSGSFVVLADALAPFVANPTAPHGLMIDVESMGEGKGFALVVRSKDKTVIGQTKTPDRAEKRFNDATGARVSLTVATDSTRETLDKCATELLAFYTSETDYSARWGALSIESQRVLGVMGGVFGAQRQNRNGWKCGSFHAIASAAAQQTAKDAVEALQKIQRAASALNNVDALKTALAGAGVATGESTPDALLASVQALLKNIGLGASTSTPSTEPTSTSTEPTEPVSTPTEPTSTEPTDAGALVGAGVSTSTPTEPTSTPEPTSTRKNRKNGK